MKEGKGINVLSLCDGMSCGQIALNELGININNYYASEIEKYAIKVTQDNFPDTKQLGDVTTLCKNIKVLSSLPKIDVVLFGFPCRSLSNANFGKTAYNNGLNGTSGVFYSCYDVLNWIKKHNNKDVLFLVENVNSAKIEDLNIITNMLGVNPILINSNLFSAQDRERLYWTNIPFDSLPTENNMVLEDILDEFVAEKYYYNKSFTFHGLDKKVCATLDISGHDILKRVNNKRFKCPTLTSCRGGNHQKKVFDEERNLCRKLTPGEYRKLQTIPDWYKMDVSDIQIYNMCGDGWTIDVIKHLLKNIGK